MRKDNYDRKSACPAGNQQAPRRSSRVARNLRGLQRRTLGQLKPLGKDELQDIVVDMQQWKGCLAGSLWKGDCFCACIVG